jgi:hypothetical protein
MGAVFSIVLMILFMSGLVKGGLFPEFSALTLLPTEHKDYALLFFWSFIAGFAEQFVPDVLDHFVSRGQEAIKTAPTPTPDNLKEESKQNVRKDRKIIPQVDADESDDEHVNGCDAETQKIDITPDEALPPAGGGWQNELFTDLGKRYLVGCGLDGFAYR